MRLKVILRAVLQTSRMLLFQFWQGVQTLTSFVPQLRCISKWDHETKKGKMHAFQGSLLTLPNKLHWSLQGECYHTLQGWAVDGSRSRLHPTWGVSLLGEADTQLWIPNTKNDFWGSRMDSILQYHRWVQNWSGQEILKYETNADIFC